MSPDPAARLAAELHAMARRLHSVDADPELLEELADGIAALRERLDGPPRLRWYELPPEERDGGGRRRVNAYSLFRGTRHAFAPPVDVTFQEVDGRPTVVGQVTCSRMYEGPPGGVHGGYVAGIFDDVLGSTQQLLRGPTALTGVLTVRYRQLTPIDTPLTFHAWVDHERGRRIVARGTCRANGTVTAEAQALFVRVDIAAAGRRAAARGGA